MLQPGLTSTSKVSAVALGSLVIKSPCSSSEEQEKMCDTGIVIKCIMSLCVYVLLRDIYRML